MAVPAGMTGRSLLPILESEKSGRVESDRDCIVTGLEWHGEFDPVSRSCRSIRDDRHAYVLRYANVDEAGEPLETAARGPPTDWGEFVQAHDDLGVFQASPEELPAIDIHSV